MDIIIYSDFDGTISKNDILDQIIIDIYSYDTYKNLENKLLTNDIQYEEYLCNTFNDITFDITTLSRDVIDDKFNIFYEWIMEKNINFYIISSGFKKIINHLVPFVNSNLIYGNDIDISNTNKWNVKLYDNNKSINKLDVINNNNKLNYKTIFIGDGLSDFKVIGNVDYLLCKNNSLLHAKCLKEQSDFILFNDFGDVLEIIKKIISNF